MKNIIKIFIIPLLLVNISICAADETFYNLQGKAADLQSYLGKGKWTVVMIWVSNCPICNKEAPEYEKFSQKYKTKDIMMLGLSMDGLKYLDDAKAFIRQHGVTFTNLVGDPEAVAAFYNEQTGDNWYGTPTFLVYSPQGKLKAAQSGAVPPKVIEEYIEKNRK